jgi:hypothetical protein
MNSAGAVGFRFLGEVPIHSTHKAKTEAGNMASNKPEIERPHPAWMALPVKLRLDIEKYAIADRGSPRRGMLCHVPIGSHSAASKARGTEFFLLRTYDQPGIETEDMTLREAFHFVNHVRSHFKLISNAKRLPDSGREVVQESDAGKLDDID